MTISLIRRNYRSVEGLEDLTVLEFMNASRSKLEEMGMEESRLITELLLCDVLKCDRLNLYLDFEKPLSKEEISELNKKLERRLADEPLQLIEGKANFFGYEFTVDGNVLIPRPETEILVEIILEHICNSGKKKVEILEVGTGSGCIAIALCKELDKMEIDYSFNSVDVSAEALIIANQNLLKHGPYKGNVRFHEKNIFDVTELKKHVDYLISNPPYISQDDFENLQPEVKNYEPAIALTDRADGLSFHRKLIMLFAGSNQCSELFIEIGFGQKNSLIKLLDDAGIVNYKFIEDYSGIPRIIHASK